MGTLKSMKSNTDMLLLGNTRNARRIVAGTLFRRPSELERALRDVARKGISDGRHIWGQLPSGLWFSTETNEEDGITYLDCGVTDKVDSMGYPCGKMYEDFGFVTDEKDFDLGNCRNIANEVFMFDMKWQKKHGHSASTANSGKAGKVIASAGNVKVYSIKDYEITFSYEIRLDANSRVTEVAKEMNNALLNKLLPIKNRLDIGGLDFDICTNSVEAMNGSIVVKMMYGGSFTADEAREALKSIGMR